MTWWIPSEAHSAELALNISYPVPAKCHDRCECHVCGLKTSILCLNSRVCSNFSVHVNTINNILRPLIILRLQAGRIWGGKKWNSDHNILHKVKVEHLLNSCQEVVKWLLGNLLDWLRILKVAKFCHPAQDSHLKHWQPAKKRLLSIWAGCFL